MYAVERLSSYISRGVYTVSGPFHPFGGAVDIIVVEQEDGSFKSSPWNVRFGKFQGVLKTREKIVDISVNGVESNFHMYLDHKGEAFFLKEVDVEEGKSMLYAPSLSSGDEKDDKDEQPRYRRPAKSKSYNFGANGDMPLASPPDASNGKTVPRTTSRRGRLLGFVFGQKSMKKESLREEESDAEVTRISSLERAEIAADLLEVRWATTLAIKNPNKDKASQISAEDCLEIKADDDGNIQTTLRVNEDMGNGSDPSQLQEENVMCDREMSDESQSGFHNPVCSVREAGIEMSYLGTPVETSVLDETNLGENYVLSGTLGAVEEVVDADDHDNAKSVASSITISDSEIPQSAGLEVGPYEQLNEEAFDEKNAVLSDRGVLKEENEQDRVQSFMYCETSGISTVGLDGSIKETQKTLYLACGGSGDDHAHAETLHETTELIPETQVPETIHIDQHTVTEGLAEIIKSEVKLVKVPEIHSQDSSPTHSCLPANGEGGFEGSLVMRKSLNDEMVRVDSKSDSAEETISHESFIISSFGNLGEDQCNEIIRDEKGKSELEPSLESIGGPHEFGGDCVTTKVMTISSPWSPDEEQFLFSDDDFKSSEVHSLDLMSLDPMEKENSPSLILDTNGKTDDLFDANYESYSPPDSSVQENTPDDSANLVNKSNAVSTPISIPSGFRVTDEKVERQAESLPNIGPFSGDLDAHELHRTISHSLDSNSKSLGWALLRNNISTLTKLNADDKNIFLQEQPSIDDNQIPRDLKNVLANAAVEISLCKHLLYEGMGAAAASQAFEAEKLDIDKFDSLSPDMLKNDNLVARIRGRYFPWNAAAPIVMQMLPFGREQILELKGMIAVDQVEKTLEVDPSKAIVTSGGSWRLWPFPFRRSKAIPSVQPSVDNTRQPDSENAEETTDQNAKEPTDRNARETTDRNAKEATDWNAKETMDQNAKETTDQNAKETTDENAKDTTDQNAKETTDHMDENDIVCKPKLTKKKVRVITPTSEQLASLNLKEGRNTITFTFSTSMLGKQQVDASIYLWKWNTRIVISDVDGTITKSDVLGQFMPMVGVDWSHTGVTHLFSAIKENGYQFLFLSARSISQAYITRQFLFNLKQDGKALPDGPVVISPDGLFPSLYREVIRRAPHEFKIACLEDIRALFPSDCNPFYAGFGNRDSDEISYLKVGIPKGKIFIINPKGEVAVNRLVDTRSYPSLHALVNGMFPPASSTEQEAYNEWNFWRLPPHVDI